MVGNLKITKRQKNTKETMINHKETRVSNDGGFWALVTRTSDEFRPNTDYKRRIEKSRLNCLVCVGHKVAPLKKVKRYFTTSVQFLSAGLKSPPGKLLD